MRKGEELQPSVLFVPSRDGTAKVVLPAETGSADEMLVTREPMNEHDLAFQSQRAWKCRDRLLWRSLLSWPIEGPS